MRTLATFAACLTVSLSLTTGAFAKEAPKADNTAQNKGATEKNAVTAEKQSNKKSDVKVLAAIRKSIMKEKGLSMDAKNVKLLYADGCLTLRGPVDSEDEKTKVADVAKASCSDITSVKNEITVAEKPH